MCTAISDNFGYHLFGRTLDLEFSFGECVAVTPRHFPINFLHGGVLKEHFSIIGTAHIHGGMPLYYDAANERGLAGAALNFPGYARYKKAKTGMVNLASAEIIPRVLSTFSCVDEAVSFLKEVNITDDSLSEDLPLTPLHWIFADSEKSITVESGEDRVKIYENPHGVLTNSPDFSYHLANLANYASLSPKTPRCNICKEKVTFYSRGIGSFGLPGDFSSASRFVRAVFLKSHTVGDEPVTRFFHIMNSLSVPLGAIITDEKRCVSTIYSSCIDTAKKIYYFTTYKNRRIRAVRLTEELAKADSLTLFEMSSPEDISFI